MRFTRTVSALALGIAVAGCSSRVSAEFASASTTQFSVSTTRNGREFSVRLRGTIERLSDDGRGIAELGPDSELTVTDGSWLRRIFLGGRRLVLRSNPDGTIGREYYSSGVLQPFEPEGAAWLADLMPWLLTKGFAAQARVTQLLQTSGPEGVFEEIVNLNSDYVERIYLRTLLEQSVATGTVLTDTLALAGREIGSDYELRQFLKGVSEKETAPEVLVGVLQASLTLQSDYEMSQLLQSVASRLTTDALTTAFFNAAATINSDYENRRVLNAVVVSAPTVPEKTLAAVLAASTNIGSDYELASLLIAIAQRHVLSEPLHQAYLAAAKTISSDYEQNRAFAALVRRQTQ